MPPQRIISVVPSQTELLYDLGLDQEIVGITKFCIHPAEKVKDKFKVGGTKTLHLDQIHDLKPDFILANKEENTREQIEELQRHYPVHVTDVNTVPDALAMIREVSELVGKGRKGEKLAKQIEDTFYDFKSVQSSGHSVAYFIWRKPYMVAANQTFIHSMLELAGFQNAFGGLTRYPEVTETDLKTAQPDLIFLSSEPYPFSEKHRTELQEICPAARVLLVDGELFSWYGSRLLKSADYIQQLRQRLGLQ
ncbi:ABC transporter substrate-binding protein [Larkinella punicea]|uniref:Cobalamin-binding protein n=1 Tax=Larkinella punicea TaxID=2315727 RepID=A0A368JWC4_9BACT|nr:helical backbone metal receptor [Larkinella punicea]RCR70893.1 cobalamin-binding protein [Larkinella punicea]